MIGDKTKIEWADTSWNPVRGCSRVSRGCDNCYAERMSARFSGPGLYAEGFAKQVHGKPHWTGRVELIETALSLPLRWKAARRIFVNSMSDLFHEALSDQDIDRVFAVMEACPHHTFLVLTKRPDHMLAYTVGLAKAHSKGRPRWPMPHVHMGISVEDEESAAIRIPVLRATPAAVRWISYEPALGPVDWEHWLQGIDGLVCGGESGPGANPMHPDWARAARDACAREGAAFFFKQFGDWVLDGVGGFLRVGKKAAGRVLDGRTYDEWPGAGTYPLMATQQ